MDLSIIILSYNTKDITDQCLSTLQASVDNCQKKLNNQIEVIVLDNASSDDSADMVENKHRWVKLIKSKENTGYGGGNNLVLLQAKYPLVLFLNSDVFVEEDTIQKAIEYFQEHECDVLGIKLTFENGSFQPSAGNLPNPLNTILWILGLGQLFNPFHPRSEKFFNTDKKVGWIMGAFFLIKKDAFEKAGGFDESIFMYMDEVDLCKRLYKKGYKVCFTPSVNAIHLHRASSSDNPEKAYVRELEGIRIYFKKYFPLVFWEVKFFLILGLLLRIIVFFFFGNTKRARAYMEGLSVI